MNDRKSTGNTSIEAEAHSLVRRFLRRWRPRTMAEQYLSDATDLADLERRMRVLERASNAPMFVTFNH
jgi:hypothetical protein